MVYDSQHPPEKRAVAANLAISCLKRKAWEDGDVLSTSLGFAEISCRFGPFSWCILHLMQLHEREGWDLQHGPKKLTTLPHLWKAYDQFREETGIQKMNPTICAKCHKKPRKGEKLRKCAGLCIDEKKPLYCGRVCQKAVRILFLPSVLLFHSTVSRTGTLIESGAKSRKLIATTTGPQTQNARIGNTMRTNLTNSTYLIRQCSTSRYKLDFLRYLLIIGLILGSSSLNSSRRSSYTLSVHSFRIMMQVPHPKPFPCQSAVLSSQKASLFDHFHGRYECASHFIVREKIATRSSPCHRAGTLFSTTCDQIFKDGVKD